MDFLNYATVRHANLASGIDDSVTSLDVLTGQGADFIPTPCIAVLSTDRSLGNLKIAEHVRLDSRSTDNYTITRGIINSAQTHVAGTYLLGFWSPEHFAEIQRMNNRIEGFLDEKFGTDVIIRDGLDAAHLSGMTIRVEPGYAFIDNELYFSEQTDLLFVAPSGATRDDIIQACLSTMLPEIKQGTEGGPAASVDAGCILLHTVEVEVSDTTVAPVNARDFDSTTSVENLGIGTLTPSRELEVLGAANVVAAFRSEVDGGGGISFEDLNTSPGSNVVTIRARGDEMEFAASSSQLWLRSTGFEVEHDCEIGGDLIASTKTPASAGATGTEGTVTWDADYIYICIATDTWKRVAISTWP